MTEKNSIPYLSETDLQALGITTPDVIESIETCIRGSADGTVWSAPKAVITPPDGRYMMAALAACDSPSVLAVKTVVLNPRNPDKGLPQINGLVTLLDSDSGLPLAIMDGNWVTAVRTAGLSAVAAKHMANPDSQVVGFIGCGVQARSHLQAFKDMFPLTSIKLFGRGQANIDALQAFAAELGLASEVCPSGQEAIQGCDLVVSSVTITGEIPPFLDPHELKPGCFAAITDTGVPWHKDNFTAFRQITIDDMAQEATMEKKLADPTVVTGDISQMVLGKFKGRQTPEDRTAFLFRGYALGDLALSALALERYNDKFKS